jgi:predicted transposase/invertase (TIGR01784 family)
MISKFLDPKNDFAFRKIFGSERNKDILIHFINDILVFKDSLPIIDVTFIKTIQDPEIISKKTSIVDVLCRDEKGNQYIVEMQVAKEIGFTKRAQYYAAKAYANQANVGGLYENLKEIIFIAISNFVMFPDKTGFKSDHIILDKDSYAHDLKDFSFTFLELPKFKKKEDNLQNITDKWMYFFKGCPDTTPKDLAKIIGSDSIIEKAYHELDRFYWNEEELLAYDQAEKYEGAYNASMRQKLIEGREEGIREGEQQKALLIAKNLLQTGFDIQTVMNVTQLTRQDIEQLSLNSNAIQSHTNN